MPVRSLTFLVAGLLVAAPLAGAAAAGPNDVHDLVKSGEIMPFEAIQRRIMQGTSGEYMGSQFDHNNRIYRFRFLQDGNLVNIDVDARTGERIRRRQSY